MASSRDSANEDANALCYVWLTFALLIISLVCFATASPQNSLIYVGIVFMAAASISAFAYLFRRVLKKHNSCFTEYCSACCCECCKDGCRSFCRFILCLPAEDSVPTMALSRRDRQRIDVLHRTLSQTEDGSLHRVTVTDTGDVILIPGGETIEFKLQRLEQEIKRLRQDYEFLRRQECVDTIVQQDFEHLDTEEERLFSWKENEISATELEIKAMKGRLKRVARNFRLARARIYSQNSGVTSDIQSNLATQVNMDAPEQVRIFATDVPAPPAYSETDPQPTSTKRFSEQNSQASRPAVISTPVLRTVVPSTSGAYHNPGFIGSLADGIESQPPPGYDMGAPPPYAEATASPI